MLHCMLTLLRYLNSMLSSLSTAALTSSICNSPPSSLVYLYTIYHICVCVNHSRTILKWIQLTFNNMWACVCLYIGISQIAVMLSSLSPILIHFVSFTLRCVCVSECVRTLCKMETVNGSTKLNVKCQIGGTHRASSIRIWKRASEGGITRDSLREFTLTYRIYLFQFWR